MQCPCACFCDLHSLSKEEGIEFYEANQGSHKQNFVALSPDDICMSIPCSCAGVGELTDPGSQELCLRTYGPAERHFKC